LKQIQFFQVSISSRRLSLYLIYCSVLALSFPFVAAKLGNAEFLPALVLAYALGGVVPLCVVFGRRLDLVEPLYWFSMTYFLVFVGAVYFLVTDFAYSEHLLQPGKVMLVKLTTRALGLFLIGYVSYLAGYLVLMRDRESRRVRLPTSHDLSGWAARTAVAICVLIGALNFLYLLTSYPGGTFQYLIDFGRRAARFEAITRPVTTFGYQFLYAGVFVWFVALRRDALASRRRSETFAFSLVVCFSVLVSISQGRLTQTISYLLILGFMGYVFSPRSLHNLRFLLLAAVAIPVGIGLYFLRLVSVGLSGIQAGNVASLTQYLNAFLPALGYWLIDKGNIPNLPVVINLVNQNGFAGELWYGQSFAAAITRLSPVLGDLPNIGETAGALWFHGGGGLPPTIVGEMFLNFGYLGVPAGLFAAGLLSSWFYRFVVARGTYAWYLVYLIVLFRFIFVWPKGESANIVAAFWLAFPMLCVLGAVKLLTFSARLR
jgi:oligosaccharide repeat unit polymerase